MIADAHGQQRCLILGGHRLLHGNGVADGAQDLVAARGIGQRHAVVGGRTQQLRRGLIHLEQVPFAVGHDDRLEDGLQHRVGELKLHLTASGLGVAQLAQPHRDPVQFAGDHPEVVAAAPLRTVLQIALGDSAGVLRQHVDRPQNKIDDSHSDQCQNRQEYARQLELPGRAQGAVRGRHQPCRKTGKQHTAENQSLG